MFPFVGEAHEIKDAVTIQKGARWQPKKKLTIHVQPKQYPVPLQSTLRSGDPVR